MGGGVSDHREIHMSWINLGEVYYRVAVRKETDAADAFLADFLLLPITLHEPAKTDILSAARLKSAYRMSYADAFAAALAEKLDAVIWTGDPELVALGKKFKVQRLFRQ